MFANRDNLIFQFLRFCERITIRGICNQQNNCREIAIVFAKYDRIVAAIKQNLNYRILLDVIKAKNILARDLVVRASAQ